MAIGGVAFSQMVEREKLFDIVLRLPPEMRNDPKIIGRIPVDAPGTSDGNPGYRIPLSAVGSHQGPRSRGLLRLPGEQPPLHPDQIRRQGPRPGLDHRRGPAKGDDPKTGAPLPEGYDIIWSGEFEQMEQANTRLMWIVPLSLGLIMMLLYTMFTSVKDCMLVMVNVVEASMGGVFALYMTGTHFSISAAVGFVSVFGVAVQDGVLLVSYFNQMRERGYRCGTRVCGARNYGFDRSS